MWIGSNVFTSSGARSRARWFGRLLPRYREAKQVNLCLEAYGLCSRRSDASTDDLVRVDAFIDNHAEEREHHFFPSHLTVVHGFVWIRIPLVVRRVVVMRVNVQF